MLISLALIKRSRIYKNIHILGLLHHLHFVVVATYLINVRTCVCASGKGSDLINMINSMYLQSKRGFVNWPFCFLIPCVNRLSVSICQSPDVVILFAYTVDLVHITEPRHFTIVSATHLHLGEIDPAIGYNSSLLDLRCKEISSVGDMTLTRQLSVPGYKWTISRHIST